MTWAGALLDNSMLTCRVLSFMVRKEIQAVIKKGVLELFVKKKKKSTIQTFHHLKKK